MKAFDTIQGGPEDDSTSDSDFEDEQGGTVSLALPDVCVCKNCRLCKYSCSLCVPFPQAAIVAFYIFYSIAYLPYRNWKKLTFVKTFFAKTKAGVQLFQWEVKVPWILHSRFEETNEPYRCCGEENCLALGDKVKKLIDGDILQVQICHRYASGEDKNMLKPENFRYVAYRNIFFLLHGRTRAKMSRHPLPSCIVMKIRESYPDPNNRYTGFRSKKQRTDPNM